MKACECVDCRETRAALEAREVAERLEMVKARRSGEARDRRARLQAALDKVAQDPNSLLALTRRFGHCGQ